MPTRRPEPTEADPYYFTYIDQVEDGDIRAVLAAQRAEAADLLRGISDEASGRRYAPDKWSIREVVGHLNDTERLFVSRAFWFARGCRDRAPELRPGRRDGGLGR